MAKTLEYLEVGDVGRVLGLTPAGVRVHVESGRLVPAAVTRRGVTLFTADQIEAFRQQRQERRESGHRR